MIVNPNHSRRLVLRPLRGTVFVKGAVFVDVSQDLPSASPPFTAAMQSRNAQKSLRLLSGMSVQFGTILGSSTMT